MSAGLKIPGLIANICSGRNMTTPLPATGLTEKTMGIMIIMVITDHSTAPQVHNILSEALSFYLKNSI